MCMPTLVSLSLASLIFCRKVVTESLPFLILFNSRLRLTTLDREIDVYQFFITLHMPEAEVCPITNEIADGESVELMRENNALSRIFH